MIAAHIATKLVNNRKRRDSRRAVALVDINADFHGRRRSGDPRLDLAVLDRI